MIIPLKTISRKIKDWFQLKVTEIHLKTRILLIKYFFSCLLTLTMYDWKVNLEFKDLFILLFIFVIHFPLFGFSSQKSTYFCQMLRKSSSELR